MPKLEVEITEAEMECLLKALSRRGITTDEFLAGDVRNSVVKKVLQATEQWMPRHKWEQMAGGMSAAAKKGLFRNFGGAVMATERDRLPHYTGTAAHGFAKGGNPLDHTSDASAA